MRALIFLFGVLCANIMFAQTGPGGVGNSSTLPLWLKADAGTSTTTNLQPVSQWNDASGNANHAIQATASQRPLYNTSLINGMPALFFDNINGPNNDLLIIPDADNFDNTTGLTILTVSRPISIDNSNARAIISKRIGTNDEQSYTVFYYSSNRLSVDLEGNTNRFQSTTVFSPGRDYLITTLYDGTLASGSRARVFINENLDVTAGESSTAITNGASPVTIGTLNVNDGRPFGGYIAEVIVIRKALNLAERLIAHNYLFAKYGLSASSTPGTINERYAGDDAANGHYDFEVGGLGQEATGNNLSVASSVTGGVAVTAVSGYENGDYLLFGHASGDNAATIADVGGMTGTNNARWTRAWYFDHTNTSTNQLIDISFDMSDAGQTVTPVNLSNYVLLSRAAQFGNWTEVATAASITGDQLNFPNVSITADAYYTLGSKNYLTSPLPIALIDFSGKETEKGVELTWSTATEHNNDYFSIQRSSDGRDFKTFAKVSGAGNSAEEISYSAFDTEPFADRTYYRLVQTDFNGAITRLKTIVVLSSERTNAIQIVPNPSNGTFSFELPADGINSELKIFNSAGTAVSFTHSQLGSKVNVDAQTLPKGLYLLMLVNDRGMHTEKFVIE